MKLSGSWTDEHISETSNTVVKTEKVKWMMVPVSVNAETGFDGEGKIARIVSGRS